MPSPLRQCCVIDRAVCRSLVLVWGQLLADRRPVCGVDCDCGCECVGMGCAIGCALSHALAVDGVARAKQSANTSASVMDCCRGCHCHRCSTDYHCQCRTDAASCLALRAHVQATAARPFVLF